MELLIGAGSDHRKRMSRADGPPEWQRLVTLDYNRDHKVDIVADLLKPLPFADSSFDEIHAYQVMEHLGQQGDYRFFFRQWTDFARVLKLGGLFFGQCPSYKSMWAWGDPSHTRVLTSGSLVFLDQSAYEKQVGVTSMSDFRYLYSASFDLVHCVEDDNDLMFVLQLTKKGRDC